MLSAPAAPRGPSSGLWAPATPSPQPLWPPASEARPLQHADLMPLSPRSGRTVPGALWPLARGARWVPLTCLTGGSPEAGGALAAEAVDTVCAGPTVLTRVGSALVHIWKTGRLEPQWRDAWEDGARQGWAVLTAVELLCLAPPWCPRTLPRTGDRDPGPQVVVPLGWGGGVGVGEGFSWGWSLQGAGYGRVLQKLTQMARPPREA